MSIKCFMIEPTEKTKRFLRRYHNNPPEDKCPIHGYHNAKTFIDVIETKRNESEDGGYWVIPDGMQDPKTFAGDERWPKKCDCGFEFLETDEWQVFTDHIYKRVDNGEETTLRDAPEGAMWYATWFEPHSMWTGEDGRALMCRVPNNHDWHVDGPCSNCPWKDGSHPEHKCWVRHGVPPNVTVDKNGNTCPVGGGSIQTETWHGFLRNGELVNA